MELVMKEALSIRTTPDQTRFNRDSGYELPDCWIATYKKQKEGASMNVRGVQPGMRTSYKQILYFEGQAYAWIRID